MEELHSLSNIFEVEFLTILNVATRPRHFTRLALFILPDILRKAQNK
ncbi:MAG: hypothetical protein U0175_12295 [Caldilineaceae bacterium]